MNTQRTEAKGVMAINNFLLESNYIIPHIDFNDRTDSWDGFIFLYSDRSNKKAKLLGRVPVQVKAKDVETFSEQSTKKDFNISDLKNYRNDGGVIIFLVECCKHERKIFYNSLLPYDLDLLLNDLKENQKDKRITFQYMPSNNISELEILCREFLMHRKKQYSLPIVDFSEVEPKEIMMQGIMSLYNTFENMLLNKAQYMYGKTHINSPMYDCVTKINIEKIKKTLDKPVCIGTKQYYPNYNVVSTKDTEQIIFGDDVIFTIGKNKVNLSYNPNGNIQKRINDTEFIIKFVKERTIKINNTYLPLIQEDMSNNEDIKKIADYNKALMNLSALLSIFNIDDNNFNIDDISDKDSERLEVLIDSMVLNNTNALKGFKTGLYYFQIASLNLLTLIVADENSNIKIHDINNINDIRIKLFSKDTEHDTKDDVAASIYILLGVEDIINRTNICIDTVIQDVVSYKHSLVYDNQVLLLCLKLIKAYDKTSLDKYLEQANLLLHWLRDGDVDKTIIIINELQIIKRKRELKKNEISLLKTMTNKNHNNSLYCGISILLNDINNFNKNFSKLSNEEKDEFLNYPIYSLIKNDLNSGSFH